MSSNSPRSHGGAARARVDDTQASVVRRRHERPAVGAQDDALGLADAADDADRRRALEQRREQVAARLDGVVERDALAGEQQRRGRSRRRRVPGRRGAARRRRSRARAPGCAGRGRRSRRSRASTSSDATPASPARRRRWARPLARRPASRKARSVGVELVAVLGRPVERGGQAGAAVEAGGVAPSASQAAAASRSRWCRRRPSVVLVQPAAQPRPLVQQRLVRDLDRALGDRQQAALGELRDHVRRPARRARSGGARSRRPRPRR